MDHVHSRIPRASVVIAVLYTTAAIAACLALRPYEIGAVLFGAALLPVAAIVGRFELFSVPIEGSLQEIDKSSARLNGPLVPGGDVVQFEIAPDGSRVVYRADQELDERFEVYSVPIAPRFQHAHFQLGSPPVRVGRVKLNPALGAGQRVDEFWIAPAGGRVLFEPR